MRLPSYIHDLADCCGMHDEDVHIDTGGAMTISHNTLANQLNQTAAIIINQDGPPAPSTGSARCFSLRSASGAG
jgi:hypothetical protein